MTTEKLTPRQANFVTEYILLDGNATQAARNAGYSEKTARHQASRLLANVGITKAIERKQQALAVKTEYSITQWRADLLEDINNARADGSHSAVIKGRELLGRHIGALQTERQLAPEEKQYLGLLEQAMLSTLATRENKQPSLASDQPETAIEVNGTVVGTED